MANESTLALVSGLLNPTWQAALWYAQHMFAMPGVVTTFTDMSGMTDRKFSKYIETGVQDNLAETDDLDSFRFTFDRDILQTLTPKEVGKQFLVLDRRISTDPESVMTDAAKDIGYAIGKKTEVDLLGIFSSLTGGQFGGSGVTMSLDMVFAARARLEAGAVRGPYVVVLHPYQWLQIQKALTSLTNAAPLQIRNEAMQNFFVSQVADMTFVVPSLVPQVAVTNEVQTLTITGTPTGGTFTLKFAGAETAAIAYNATGAAVASALNLLGNLGASAVVGGGGPFPGTAVTITFSGTAVAGQDVPLITLGNNSMTGGASPTLAAVETTKGVNYAIGAVFNKLAIGYDLRRALRIEAQRDASKRGTELNATIEYAVGVIDASFGVQLRSDASTPFA